MYGTQAFGNEFNLSFSILSWEQFRPIIQSQPVAKGSAPRESSSLEKPVDMATANLGKWHEAATGIAIFGSTQVYVLSGDDLDWAELKLKPTNIHN
ncbi:hypothetical protein DAPPUDRAFT_236014 [Daphnia pulex]|uniref:Uncharacterized protein n=1 Tax=Daphnia pulex TaxID=6669 RepID=E9FZP3_DAPPU|nr:hypothetical protein DAPPUDRAFT_236014 [Daphnia pulex]|eukprot:EFX87092.1 hypothetical protein DAPPUDRAFT_236014 [Daphnia pulex]